MAAPFPRTLAALRADRGRGTLAAYGCALLLLGSWLVWSLAADVAVYRSSVRARVEVSPAPTRVAAPVGGRVVAAQLVVGARVAAGDVLVELDTSAETIAATRARARVTALEPQLESVARELAAEDDARTHGGAAELDAEREVLARQRAAEVELSYGEQELARERELVQSGASTPAQRERAEAAVARQRAALESTRHEAEALGASHRERGDSRRARREQLDREQQELASDLGAARAEAERLALEVERHIIRAPVAGTLGDVAALRPGAVVQAGDVVATVVPEGRLQVVADYGAVALGRLAVGQRARLRLDGFPWTRYGTLAARVARVGSELRDGTIRVELELTEARASLPIQHGMTGTVDVEVERASPAALVLRAIGEGLDGARPP